METTTIRLVRNATLKINYAGHNILVDPFFADKGSMQSAIGVYKTPRVHLTMPVSEITEGLDMVLQTHIHPDHYDETVKQHLPKDIRYYVQPQDKATVEQDGFTRVEVIEDKATVEGMAIHRVSGHHGFGKIGEIMGPVSGFVLKAEGQMGSLHPRNGGAIQARLYRGEQRRSGLPGVFQGGRLHHPR